jgi:uncharacterized protein (DUF433 family)
MSDFNVIAAFSEEQAARLSGVSKFQLRYWDRTNFYVPSYAEENRRMSFSRVYSFKDIVALRVLHVLKNQSGVSLQQLREVGEELAVFGPDPDRWVALDLYVLNKRVIWHEPGTDLPQEIESKQYVVPTLSLIKVIADTKRDIEKSHIPRGKSAIGHITQKQYINHNQPVVSGTRIPVVAIKRFAEAGYSVDQIIKEYPDLKPEDVKAALRYKGKKAAA